MPNPRSSVDSVQSSRTRGLTMVRYPARPIFSARTDGRYCGRVDSSLSADICFDLSFYGTAANGLERILCGLLVKETPDKH